MTTKTRNRIMPKHVYDNLLINYPLLVKRYTNKELIDALIKEMWGKKRESFKTVDQDIESVWRKFQAFSRRRSYETLPRTLRPNTSEGMKMMSAISNRVKANNGIAYEIIVRSVLETAEITHRVTNLPHNKGDFRLDREHVEVKLSARERITQAYTKGKKTKLIVLRKLDSVLRLKECEKHGIVIAITDPVNREKYQQNGAVSLSHYLGELA
jgi:hypothetical protein